MAARLFSKNPLSWGHMIFLWAGGLLVVAGTVIVVPLMIDKGNAEIARADRLALGRSEFRTTTPARELDLSVIPRIPRVAEPRVLDPETRLTPEEVRVAQEVGQEAWDKAEREMADRQEEARAVRGVARVWFGGTIALVLISAGGVGFLVWRSYHGVARA